MLCVALLMDLFVVCVDSVTKQFAICLGEVVILLLNVTELFNVVYVLCWIDRVWCSKEFVCVACDPSVHPSVPAIGFVYVFVCR